MASNPKDKVYLTEAQLSTLAGGGSIASGDDTYTADENTQYFTPDTSVSYEAQTLTAEQQAQARQNIGAGSANATSVLVGGTLQASISFDSDPQTQISAKANTSSLGSLATKNTVDYTTEVTNKPTLGTAAALNTGTSQGDIPLLGTNGKLPSSVVPASAITDTFVVASEAAMLALSSAEVGDVAVRTDLNKSFILKTEPYSTLANWQELLTPTDAVTSVNSQTGVVVLTASDVGAQSTIDSSHKLSADLVEDGTTNKVFTATEQSKLSGIASGAEVNVQANWNEADSSSDAYIQNKPTIIEPSNPNLLINGDFRVNQRGQRGQTAGVYEFSDVEAYTKVYTVDRWRFVPQVNNSTSTVTVNANSISIYCANQYDDLSQFIEDYDKFAGKTVTLSLKVKSKTSNNFIAKIRVDGSQVAYVNINNTGILSTSVTLPNSITTSLQVSIVNAVNSASSVEIEYIKLEVGSVATLFSPRPYAEELAMCQRYYWKSTSELGSSYYGYSLSSSSIRTIITMPQVMRTAPTISSLNASSIQIIGAGQQLTPTAYSYQQYSSNRTVPQITYDLTCSNSSSQAYIIRLLQGFSLDAEIY